MKYEGYIDESTGATADSVYVTNADGDEIGSFKGKCWNDEFIGRLEAEHGQILAMFCGGTLDGFEAY
jgi:hypothetical protein